MMNAVEEGDANMMGAPYNRIGLREFPKLPRIMTIIDLRWRRAVGEAWPWVIGLAACSPVPR